MNIKRLLTEFIGTFFLVFTIGMAVIDPGIGPLAPIAIGAVLAVMVYAGGPVSGGHYNPAVSLAAVIRGALPSRDLIPYWAVQFAAAVVAAAVTVYLKDGGSKMPMEPHILSSLLAEFLFTFALCWVVLSVATARSSAGNSYFGFAIGFTVLAGAFAVGAISGGAFNPAVALGICTMNLVSFGAIWIYLVANFLGAIVAGVTFLYTHGREAP